MEIMEILNQYSGLFSLLAVLASVVIPIVIYKKEKCDQRKAAQDELDAINDVSTFPMSMEEQKFFVKKNTLEKQARRR